MSFDKPQLQIIEKTSVDLPGQKISKNYLVNASLNIITGAVEKYLLRIKGPFDITQYTFRSPIETPYPENNVGYVRHYKASDDRAVIILPQRGRGYNFAQVLATYLASNGISAYEMESPLRGARKPEGFSYSTVDSSDILRVSVKQAVAEVRGLTDIIEEKHIGILGISLGAMYSSIAFGVEDSLKSCVLVHGVGNLADLVFASNDKLAKSIRNYLDRTGMSKEEFRADIADIEPTNLANPRKKSSLLMIHGSKDLDTPMEFCNDLALAWGNPQQYLVSANHLSIAWRLPRIFPMVLEHFEKTLK